MSWVTDPIDPIGALTGLSREAFAIKTAIGPVHIELEGRAVYFLIVSVALLTVAAIPVAVSRSRELRRRWLTWLAILPVLGLPIWWGLGSTTVLAIVIALQCVREYVPLAKLKRADGLVLAAAGIALPIAAWKAPELLTLTPLVALTAGGPAIVQADTRRGVMRAAFGAFGVIWICWSLAGLVTVWQHAYLVCFAAAATDVAAWCGGKGLHRWRWAARPLSPLSPSKTVGGAIGALIGAAVILAVLGHLSIALVVAVALGCIIGDLLESMLKRHAGVKDAGHWLPGFGGLLDRVDSLLLVLPLATIALA